MSNDLVASGGRALVPASTDGTVGEHIGDMSVDRGGAGQAEPPRGDPQALASLYREFLRDCVIEGIEKQKIERCLDLIADCAPLLAGADIHARARVADSLRAELIQKGLLRFDEVERIRQVLLRRSSSDAEHAMRSIVPDSDVAARIATIETWMSAPRGSTAYKRYYDDENVQKEYLQLQRRRQ